ncbi:MAG: hypothetical protein ACR2LI_14745 [Propionibacteriaceae bacterium]
MSDPVLARSGGEPVAIRHGRWSAEVHGDEVAEIRVDGVRLLRAIRPVVRDADWNTVEVRVVDQRRQPGAGLTLVTELIFEAPGITYQATIRLVVEDDQLTVELAGRALAPFVRNRIGLVVLHPADDAGRPVQVHHSNQTSDVGHWPVEISPHQPFRDVSGFAWSRDGVSAVLAFDGEVFETEDQRNWTDASFKTYSTPLDRPFPVAVELGEECRQQIRLTARGRRTTPAPVGQDALVIGTAVVGVVPPVSLGAALYPAPTDLSGLSARAGAYDAVLVELTGPPARWPELLAAAAAQADALDAPLDVRLVTGHPEVVRHTVRGLVGFRVARLAAYSPDTHLTTAPLWQTLREAARRHVPTAELVGGTRAHFTELNRQQGRVPVEVATLTFSLTPQMHATEVPHLVDSLTTQRTVIDNALRIAAGRPVHVGPITLRRRFNAVATTDPPDPADEATAGTDPLLGTGFAAAWTLGSVAALAVPGVAGLSYFETAGPRGILADQAEPRPVSLVLDTVARWRGRSLLRVSCPPGTTALATTGDDAAVEVLVANLTGHERTLPLRLAADDADDADEAITLAPWSVTAWSSRTTGRW